MGNGGRLLGPVDGHHKACLGSICRRGKGAEAETWLAKAVDRTTRMLVLGTRPKKWTGTDRYSFLLPRKHRFHGWHGFYRFPNTGGSFVVRTRTRGREGERAMPMMLIMVVVVVMKFGGAFIPMPMLLVLTALPCRCNSSL